MVDQRWTAKGLRVLGELAIVFVGVVLALLAENWRSSREAHRQARSDLIAVAADLRLDAANLAAVDTSWARVEGALSWLAANWTRPQLPADSVEIVLDNFYRATFPTLVTSGFDALESNGSLPLLGDSVRLGLVQYYESTHPNVGRFFEMVLEAAQEFEDGIDPLIRLDAGTGESGSMWPPPQQGVRLVRPWRLAAEDSGLYNQLVTKGRTVSFFRQLVSAALEENAELQRLVERAQPN